MAAEQLEGADSASRLFAFGAKLALAGRAPHFEAVSQPIGVPPDRMELLRGPKRL